MSNMEQQCASHLFTCLDKSSHPSGYVNKRCDRLYAYLPSSPYNLLRLSKMPLPPVVPPLARQIMRDAFGELERIITSTDANDFPASTLESVRQEALDIEKALGSEDGCATCAVSGLSLLHWSIILK